METHKRYKPFGRAVSTAALLLGLELGDQLGWCGAVLIADICRQLDSVPTAIVRAATRLKLLGAEQLSAGWEIASDSPPVGAGGTGPR